MKKIWILTGIILVFFAGCVWHRKETESFWQKEEKIRVLICTEHFESRYHKKLSICTKDGCEMKAGEKSKKYGPGQIFEISMENWPSDSEDVLMLTSGDGVFEFPELTRDYPEEKYQGIIEIRRTPKGILLINELPLEEYLCGVVPSEMPSSYPIEALKAQAVCARTYALRQKTNPRLQEYYADVDDSTAFQVYNNQKRSEWTDLAVKETNGIVLMSGETYSEAMYYSTSCGLDLQIDLSEEAVMAAFLIEDKIQSFEVGEPMFRWQANLNLKLLDDAEKIQVIKRSEKGAVEKLAVTKKEDEEIIYIEGEYEIRRFLAQAKPEIFAQDGSRRTEMQLLPSAFFIISNQDLSSGTCVLIGGGCGHGNGMSQNGAKHMALDGRNYEEILKSYYADAKLVNLEGE